MPGFQQQPASEPSRAWLYDAQNSNPRRDRPADAVEAGVWRFFEGMLPDADDLPAFTPQLPVYASVARHVVLALFVPEFLVRFRAGVALGADVPIASAGRRPLDLNYRPDPFCLWLKERGRKIWFVRLDVAGRGMDIDCGSAVTESRLHDVAAQVA